MSRLVLVTDSTADLPAETASGCGILVAPARYGFPDHAFSDGDLSSAEFYRRMSTGGAAPKPFGVPEAAFRAIFGSVRDSGGSPLCLVSPFDVNPSFTTALAAMLSLDGLDMKVINAGVASAGLGALLLSLSAALAAGRDRTQLLDALEVAGPQCDTLFVPSSAEWIERSGRLALIAERTGEVADTVVVRVGSRITGVALAADRDAGLRAAVRRAGARLASGARVFATVSHAVNPEGAGLAATALQAAYAVERLVICELSATIGSQLGPGAVGIGIAPAIVE